jgi:hypothetical protein
MQSNNMVEFIDSCKLLLKDGVMEYNVINGQMVKCTNFTNDKIEVIKSMVDYSLIIKKKDGVEPVLCINGAGYVSKIKSEWKELAKELETV